MRLHTLRVEAFGPFAQTQTVDFDGLGEAGVYLVHGPTGAGKTSVLDAVCFALFNDVPGERSAKGLRSDLATDERGTSVTLEFTCSARRFRISRSPEHRRPKRRGSGDTTEPAKVLLQERAHGAWNTLSTRIEETGDVIKDVLGMGLAQFQRVVLLPQGEFAQFLRASPQERHGLLTALFDVATYEAVEAWFADERREGRRALDLAERELGFRARGLLDTLGGLPEGWGDPPETVPALSRAQPGDWPGLAPVVLGWLEDLVARATGADERARAIEVAARTAHERILGLSARRKQGLAARDRLAELTASAAAVDADRTRLDRGRAAASLRGELAARDRAAGRARTAEAALGEARAGLCRLRIPLGEPTAGDVVRMRAACRAASVSLDDARRASVAVRRADADRAGAHDAWAAAQAARAMADVALADARADLLRLAAASEEAEKRMAPLATAAERLRILRRRADLLDALAESTRAADDLGRRLLEARERAVSAGETLLALQRQRLADLAGELAADLTPGQPCPVCGSGSHPRPADPAPGWTPEAIAEADRISAEHADKVAALRDQLAGLAARRGLQAAELAELPGTAPTSDDLVGDDLTGEDLAGEDLAEALRRADRAHAAALDAERALPGARAAAKQAADCVATAQQHQAETLAALTSARATRDDADRRAAEAGDDLARAVAAHGSCPCVVATTESGAAEGATDPSLAPSPGDAIARLGRLARRHDEVLAALDGAHAAGERVIEAADEVEAAASALAESLSGSPFADATELSAAVIPGAELERLAESILGYDAALAVARATLADPDFVAALEGPDPADPDESAARLAEARTFATAAARDRHDTERITGSVGGQLSEILLQSARTDAARERHDRVAALADLVAGTSGDNTLRMRLSAFVLAARLERVVDLANERLLRMGEGRFQLEHVDSPAPRGARSGLGLVVRDEWAGTVRATGSLSGGESFLASLALALGLADALRESSGGVEMQTLFVDEGFGGLDEASLDEVLDVLDDLRDGGRSVGIISHVAQLRSHIPTQLEVLKSPAGSTIRPRLSPPAA